MTVFVVDASAIAELLLQTPAGRRVAAEIRTDASSLHIPALCDVEVAAVLRRALLSGRLDAERAAEALQDFLDLPLTRHGHTRLLPRVLALRANFSVYDATYVALAEALGARLMTADQPLVRALRRHTAIDVVSVAEEKQ